MPTIEPEKQLETASWLWDETPSNWESLKQLVTTRVSTLFDGAYFGFTWESILVKESDKDGRIIKISQKHPTRGKILAYNPGAQKVSRFFPLYPEWHSLAIRAWEWYERVNHIEAENAKLIREAEYDEIFRYLNDGEARTLVRFAHIASTVIARLIDTNPNQPKTGYQVTKEWVKSGLFLVNNKYEPSDNKPFLGGWGSFRRRKRVTV